ncbi:DUF6898 family protein [Maricaulis sp. CAU 1757]
MAGREIYIEIINVGPALRVAAVDAETGIEMVFQVPSNTPRRDIDQLARAKIVWKLSQLEGQSEAPDETKKRPGQGPGRGIRV